MDNLAGYGSSDSEDDDIVQMPLLKSISVVEDVNISDEIPSVSSIGSASTVIASTSIAAPSKLSLAERLAQRQQQQELQPQPAPHIESTTDDNNEAITPSPDIAVLIDPILATADKRLQKEQKEARFISISQREITTLSKDELIDAELDKQFGSKKVSSFNASVWNSETNSEETTGVSKNAKRKHQITDLAAKAEESQRKLLLRQAQQSRRR